MLNRGAPVEESQLKVIDYSNAIVEQAMSNGQVNTEDDVIVANIRSSIRRGHQQIKPGPPQAARVCIVGSGPSLADTEQELRDLYFEGAKVVTLNGAYHWCIDRNIRPSTQIVIDARPSNARFVEPIVPRCQYVLASQCAPEMWDAVEGRDNVWIFHASSGASVVREMLDQYYLNQWVAIGGGVTVASRAVCLLRMVGYLKFDLFGVDSCWIGKDHHAFPQPENADDKWFKLDVEARGAAGTKRTFRVSPWHLKQAEDFIQMVKVNGDQFHLAFHGDGLIAHMMRIGAEADLSLSDDDQSAA